MSPYTLEPARMKLIVFLAQNGGRATAKQLREGLNVARRTIYGALQYHLARGNILEYPYLRDTRQNVYVLAPLPQLNGEMIQHG